MRASNTKAAAYLLIILAYAFSGKAAMMLALPPGYASPIFPPAGIAVAAAFIAGRKALPWVFLGALLLNIWIAYTGNQELNSTGVAAATLIAAASMLQAAFGGWVLRRQIGHPAALDHVREIILFLLLAPLICLVSSSLSVTSLWAIGIFQASSLPENWFSWWAGDAIGLMLMFPIVMSLAGEPRAIWRPRRYTVALPVAVILAFFVLMFLKANQWEQEESLAEFRSKSIQAVSQLRIRLDEQTTLAKDLRGLFEHDANGTVSRQEFQRFTHEILTRFPDIQALEWAPRIEYSQRHGFEAEQRINAPGFEITERNAAGKLVRAKDNEVYYPITYVSPPGGNEQPLGFDIKSDEPRRAALDKAGKSGQSTATALIKLSQSQNLEVAMLIMEPIQLAGRETGIVLSVLNATQFIGTITPNFSNELYVRVLDRETGQALYDSFPDHAAETAFDSPFEFGGRQFLFRSMPTPEYFKQHRGWQSWGVFAVGAMGTGLLGALLLLGTGYTASVEAEVDERTRELAESEARYRLLFDNSPLPMWVFDESTLKFLEVNERAIEHYGYSREEFSGMTLRDIRPPEDIPLLHQTISASPDGTMSGEFRHTKKDGSIIDVAISSVQMTYGNRQARIVQVQDITARKRDEVAIRRYAAHIKMLMDSVAEGIYGVDAQGNCTFINPAAISLLGYGEERELLGKNMHAMIHHTRPDGTPYPAEECKLHQAMHTRVDAHVSDELFWRKDGNAFPVAYWSRPTLIDGQTGAVITFLDISQRRQAENALRESEEKLRGLYELSPLGISLTDMNGQYIEFNSAFEQICGYPMDELNRLDYWALTPEKYADDEARQLESLRTTGHYGPYEKEYIRKDGRLIPIRLNGLLLTGRDGRQYIWSIVEDITERKQFEQELKRSNSELEHFSYAASHDMRQPLRMISSYLQLLEEELGERLTPEQREFFGFAVDGAQRMDRMLLGMLEYSRVGRLGVPFTREDSRKLLDEVLLLLKSDIENSQATLDITGDWPQLVVSRYEFVRLMQNLVGNALKYRREGVAPHIHIAGRMEKESWRLCVADNGIGIAPAQAGRLFQMFQRLQAHDKFEGSGIGLALCRRIAEHHGGRIWVESAGENMGSTFCVEIPQESKG